MPRRRRFEPTHSAEDLRAIARSQRWLMLCLLAQLGVWVGYIVLNVTTGGDLPDESPLVALGLTVLLGAAGAVFVFLLAVKTSGPTAGAVLAVLTLVPCLGLIMLLVTNVQATGVLKAHGVRVGLLGARMADIAAIEDGYAYPDEEEDEGW